MNFFVVGKGYIFQSTGKNKLINLSFQDMGTPTDCPACLEEYVDPRQLPCGHTYCLNCLEIMCLKQRVQCQICGRIHVIPKNGVPEFKEVCKMEFWGVTFCNFEMVLTYKLYVLLKNVEKIFQKKDSIMYFL